MTDKKRLVITFDELERVHGKGNASIPYNKLAQLTGSGSVGEDFLGGYPAISLRGDESDAELAQIESHFLPQDAKPTSAPKAEDTKTNSQSTTQKKDGK